MNWLLLTVFSIIARATYSLGTRLLGRDVKVSPQTQTFVLTFTIGVIALVTSPFIGGISFNHVNSRILPILIIVISSAIANIIYFKGQKNLDAGTTQIAFSSILIWGAILSTIFLNSKFSFIQIIGILLMLAAIILIQNKKSSFNLNSGFVYIIMSAFLFAMMQVSSASISKAINTSAYLIIFQFGMSFVILLFYFKLVIKDIKKLISLPLKNTSLIILFTGVSSYLYFVFSYLAYRYAPDMGVVVVLLTSQVILSVIFGIIFLKEKDNMAKKLLAGILAFLAGILIKS